MKHELILHKIDGSRLNLYNRNATSLSTVTSGEQRQTLNSDDIVMITVESAVKITLDIGDRLNVFGRWYKINRLPTVRKTGNRLFTYTIELEGVQYDLARATYDLTIDTTSNALQDVQADTLTGNLERFATVLVSNANRVFPGKWELGELPEDTEDKTLMFGETDNCLSVLQRLCTEYNTEFDISQSGGVNTINFQKAGQIFPFTFEYGKGKGLYSLERLNVSAANIVTRLKVFGGTRNITSKYRANRLCLPGKTKGQSFIEKSSAINKYGVWEATKYFDDIYPKRTSKVTGIDSGNVLKFVDNTMNFDLNEKESDGVTTKYLLPGVPAKIHFNSGNLSGYEFEILSYDHGVKTFTLKPFEDERGDLFPSEKSAAFQFGVNDEYVILDISLPQSYIDAAEAQLQSEGDTYYDQNSQPKVQYSLEVAEEFIKGLSGTGSTTNIFSVGDYIPIKDVDIDVDKSVRVQSFTRDLLNVNSYKLTISDTVTTSITNRVISDLIDLDKVVKINNLKDPARARRDWRSAQELLDMVFDVEGDYYTDKIKPNSIETQMLSVGAKSTQFGLVGTVIQANYNGNKNSVNVKGGVLTHYAIEEGGRIWNLADNTTTLTGDGTPYYIYARCQKSGTGGSIIFSTSRVTVNQDPSYYHFWVGVVNSADAELGVRSVALTYGFTTVNGRFIRTGRIQSSDGLTYFDLDTGEIGGKITFRSTAGDQDLGDWADDITGDIQDSQSAANAADAKAQQAIDAAAANVTEYNTKFAEMQNQVDGQVNNWFYPYVPTLANYPASDWTTNEIRDRHIGDTFTNTQAFVDNATTPNAGKSWRYVKNESTYSWTLIADSDAVKALLQASQAQATADGKSTTFLVQPSNYHLGDTWVLNSDRTVNGTAYKQGEILTATQDSTTFNEAHWLKRVRYTDDTAVENLEIGGRNLFSNSNTVIGRSGLLTYSKRDDINGFYSAGGDNAHANYVRLNNVIKGNGHYTVSFEMRGTQSAVVGLYVSIAGVRSGSAFLSNNLNTYNGRKYYTVEVTNYSEENSHVDFHLAYAYFYIKDIQVEKGNKATDWSPAPEDVQAEIDSAKQEALTAAGNAQTTANSLKDFTDTAFRDGIIDRSESVAIEKYKNSLNEAMSKAEASYNKVYANTYLEGAAKTALLNAKINLWGQSDTLLTAINTAIAGGTTTPAQKTAVDNAFGYFNSLMSAFQSALEEANKAIQAKLDALSTEKVNNIQIGGRNFFPLSRLSVFTTYATLKETGYDYLEVVKAAQENTVAVSPWAAYVAANLNKRIIVTGYFYINGEPVTDTYNNTLATAYRTTEYYEIDPSTGFIKCIMSPSPSVYSVIHAVFRRNGVPAKTGDVVRMEKVMVEVVESGRIHTDYVRPIEDIQKDINDAKIEAEQAQLEAEQAQLTANGYMRARYIRDWARGSSTNVNTSNWNEIRVVNKAGSNLAAGITPTTNGVFNAGSPASNITDGNISSQAFINNTSPTLNYVQIDLGQIHYDIDYIQVWHWWADGRTFYGTKTEISEDGVNWTTLFDSATEGTYPETEAGKVHTQRYEKVMAKLNQSKAITDKFRTTINGGLINTVMMLLRELNSTQETAGISGIQGANKDNPAFWAGGTYEKALALIQFLSKMSAGTTPSTGEYEGLAKITMLHNGAAKVGDFIIEESGRIVMIDPATGKVRLAFTVYNLPLIADLMGGVNFSGSTNIGAAMGVSTSQVLSGSTNVTRNGASAIFNGTTITINAEGRIQPSGMSSYARASLYARRNGVRQLLLASATVMFTSQQNEFLTDSQTVSQFGITSIQSGLYTFELVVETNGTVAGSLASVTASAFSWEFTEQNVRMQQYGLDGMMFFYSNHHFHFTEGGGLDSRTLPDKWNAPGVLAKGRILSSGSRVTEKAWGAKNSTGTVTKQGTGGYRVPVNCPNAHYDVNISPRTANRTFMLGATTATYFEVYFRDHNGNLADSEFSYTIVGNNYN